MNKVKDQAQKTLESHNDIFADIANVYLFKGRQVIDPDDLTDATTESQYKFAGDIRSQDRDIAKHWQNGTIKISVIGFENQTDDDADMPLRIMGYDGAAYRDQIRKTGHYTPTEYPGKHPQDVFATLNALTGEERFESVFDDLKEPRKEGAPMVPSIFKIKEEEWKAKEEDFKAREEDFKAKEENFKAKEENFKAKEENFKAKEEALKAREEEGRILYRTLRDAGRMDDYDRAMEDSVYKEQVLVELGIRKEPRPGSAYVEKRHR